MPTSIFIPLGYHCNITFLTQKLQIKTETGLFEWFESKKLQYITDVINNIKNNIDTSIIKGIDKHIYILHESLYSYHYMIEEYKNIFVRRAMRFLDIIKDSSEIIFIRINPFNAEQTSEDEINSFSDIILSINSNLSIKFLLINTIMRDSTYTKLDKNKINNKCKLLEKTIYYEDCKDDVYLIDNQKIANILYEYMIEFDYINTVNNKIFDDTD